MRIPGERYAIPYPCKPPKIQPKLKIKTNPKRNMITDFNCNGGWKWVIRETSVKDRSCWWARAKDPPLLFLRWGWGIEGARISVLVGQIHGHWRRQKLHDQTLVLSFHDLCQFPFTTVYWWLHTSSLLSHKYTFSNSTDYNQWDN